MVMVSESLDGNGDEIVRIIQFIWLLLVIVSKVVVVDGGGVDDGVDSGCDVGIDEGGDGVAR
jgi:hypothetical protein